MQKTINNQKIGRERKQLIINFFQRNPSQQFTIQQLSAQINIPPDSIRYFCNELVGEILTKEIRFANSRKKGKKKHYFQLKSSQLHAK